MKELKSSVKAVTALASMQKLELKGKHWQEKLKLWNEKKELKTTIAVKMQKKWDAITSFKCSHSEIAHELKMERNISNKITKAASSAATLKDQLAKDEAQ